MSNLRILLFAANPRGDLKLDEEIRAIEESLNDGQYREDAEVIPSLAARPGDLISKISRHRPSVVHFSGHGVGGGAADRGEGDHGQRARDLEAGATSEADAQILLVDEQGLPRPVSRDALGELFRYRKGDIRLVVLNACSTRPQAEMISREIDCVIGTNRSIGDEAARVFAKRFYHTLADGGSVQQAFQDARLELGLQGIPEGNTLDLVFREGVDPSRMFFVASKEPGVQALAAIDGSAAIRSRASELRDELLSRAMPHRKTIAVAAVALILAFILFSVFGTPLANRTGSRPLAYALLSLLPIGVAAFSIVPELRKKRIEEKLRDESVFGQLSRPGYFRVHPYGDNAADRELYDRADKAHVEVLEWLRTTEEPFLYLTGGSGTGKSSLLNAYALPKLREGTPRWRTITVRSYHDPIESFRRSLIELGGLGSDPAAANLDLPALVSLTANRIQDKLLILFDQFEELLIISEREPERLKAFESLVAALGRSPTPGVRVLVSMRSDFLGWLQKLNLPPQRPRENWFEVAAFRASDARDFLQRSGLEIGKGLMDDLIDQLVRIEPGQGLIRPITLNMVGLILERQASVELPQGRVQVEQLLDRYLESCLTDPDVQMHAPDVLRPMITRFRTIRPRSVEEIAQASKLDPFVISGVLLKLGNNGLVRRIDQTRGVWAVAHDFVAQLLRERLHPTLMQQAQRFAVPVLAVAVLLGAGAWYLGGPDRDPVTPSGNPTRPSVEDLIARNKELEEKIKKLEKPDAAQNALPPPALPSSLPPAEGPKASESHLAHGSAVRKALWPNGVIPYSYPLPAMPPVLRQTIEEAVRHWNNATDRVFFRPKKESDRSWVEFVMSNGCASMIGKVVVDGAQQIMVSEGCAFDNIVHELGHCVGLFHEHSRSDRDAYVEIHLENALPGTESTFDKLPQDVTDVGPLDFSSVMLFSEDAFSRNGRPTIVPLPRFKETVGSNWGIPRRAAAGLQGLSKGDVSKVEVLYPTPADRDEVPSSPLVDTNTTIRPWPGGVIPFDFARGISSQLRSEVQKAIDRFNGHAETTGVRFRQAEGGNGASIRFTPSNSCASYIGKIVEEGEQPIWVSSACDVTMILRELCHAAGLWTQHCRLDRDRFVVIHPENLIQGVENNFTMRRTGYEHFPFDYTSIMNYPELAFSKNGKPPIESRNGTKIKVGDDLSEIDRKVLARLYRPESPTQAR